MNNDIIRMARECGLHLGGPPLEPGLERFATLVRADEREACAKVCDSFGMKGSAAVDCAAAIRVRGNA